MKKILIIALTAICSLGVQAQDDAGMKAWMEYMTPGEMHKMLAGYNGKWEANTKMWMGPGTEATESKADVVTDMVMGDRYQKTTFSGNVMGMPFNGESITGYDNTRKVFVNTWIDNMSTGMMYCEGTWNAANKTMVFKGNTTDPMAGKEMPFREVVTYSSKDSYKMEMYNMYEGKEFKSMEVVYTRKK